LYYSAFLLLSLLLLLHIIIIIVITKDNLVKIHLLTFHAWDPVVASKDTPGIR
jgi:hypothetical protein